MSKIRPPRLATVLDGYVPPDCPMQDWVWCYVDELGELSADQSAQIDALPAWRWNG